MPYSTLSEFLTELQDRGELLRIAASVDSALELAAITDRVVKSAADGAPALLFENVKNSTIPVVANLLGSRARLCRALGISTLGEIAQKLNRELPPEQPNAWLGSLAPSLFNGGIRRWGPKTIKSGACQQVVKLGRDVNLWELPVTRSWPGEPFPVITAGQILIKEAVTNRCGCFQSPLVVISQQQLAWYCGNVRQNEILRTIADSGQNVPIAIYLGGDPVLQIAAAVPESEDVLAFAGFLRGANLELVRCRTNELEVPAGAEIIIEGYIDAKNPKSAQPLSVARGNGRYVQQELPLIQVTAVTHRANPVFPTVIISKPVSEESWLGVATDRLLLPLLQSRIPEIVDIHQPFSSANRNLLFVSVHKTDTHEVRRILHGLWGMKDIGRTKMIIVVDADFTLLDEEQVWFRVGTNASPIRDFVVSEGLARDDDYETVSLLLAGRVGIDATRKQSEEHRLEGPHTLIMSPEILVQVRDRWSDYKLNF